MSESYNAVDAPKGGGEFGEIVKFEQGKGVHILYGERKDGRASGLHHISSEEKGHGIISKFEELSKGCYEAFVGVKDTATHQYITKKPYSSTMFSDDMSGKQVLQEVISAFKSDDAKKDPKTGRWTGTSASGIPIVGHYKRDASDPNVIRIRNAHPDRSRL